MKKWQMFMCVFFVFLFGIFFENRDVREIQKLPQQRNFVVHIEGAVQKEGDYTFHELCTIEKALESVPVLAEANLSQVDLKQLISHDLLIYIPYHKENLISLNNASLEELQTITGIGPAKAKAIIEARPYTCLEDLMKVKGIGEKSYRKYREFFCL